MGKSTWVSNDYDSKTFQVVVTDDDGAQHPFPLPFRKQKKVYTRDSPVWVSLYRIEDLRLTNLLVKRKFKPNDNCVIKKDRNEAGEDIPVLYEAEFASGNSDNRFNVKM